MTVTITLVDSNVLLDILTEDENWMTWSSDALTRCADEGAIAIDPIIYAELSMAFDTIEDLEAAFPSSVFHRVPLPWEAGFLAGKAFLKYRRSGGAKTSPLPDFYIGAHAAITGFQLLSRDASRYRTYFPTVELINP